VNRRLVLLCVTAATAAGTAGCTSHDCDGTNTVVDGGTAGSAGRMWAESDRLVWETSPADGPWIDFRGSSSIQLNYPPGFTDPYDWTVWVSTSQYQGADASFTLTTASGQLDEVFSKSATSLTFLNATCAEYYMRAVLYARAPDAGVPDGAATRDARSD